MSKFRSMTVVLGLTGVLLLFWVTVDPLRSQASSPPSRLVTTGIDAAALYGRNCTRCHGADGRAQTAKGKQTRATDFTNPTWQNGISDARGIRVITNGHELMPAFKETMNPDEIRAVMSFVRRFKR